MSLYIVYRHSRDTDTQAPTEVVPIGIWDAADAPTARALAAEVEPVAWGHQYLTAKKAYRASNRDWTAADIHAIRRANGQQERSHA